jgi:NAD+ synthase (glutamine-hydrolysing)
VTASPQNEIAARLPPHNLQSRHMKIGFAQINPTVGDLRENCELIIRAYERLAAAGAELVLTPELAMTGYPPQDLVLKSRFVPENLELLEKLHARIGDAAIAGGIC